MKVAVVGASGIVGYALLEHLKQAQIDAIGLSRRDPGIPGVEHLKLDLMDPERCRAACPALRDVTHLVYAALYEKPGLVQGWREVDQMQTNLTMLQNLVTPLLSVTTGLRQISLLQGTKAYGAHIMPMKIPGREREPRVEHENFYWLQEDYLKSLQGRHAFALTIWRPQIIFGHALGAPMNMISAIAAYATLCQAGGESLHYPGGPSGVMEATDASLLARAIAFSFDNHACDNETFNVTNGDVFRWEDLWPGIARHLGMEAGEPKRQLLAESCYDEAAWQAARKRFRLSEITLRDWVGDSFYYADALFNSYRDQPPPPSLVSTIKLRQAGFHECLDTEDMIASWFERLRQIRLLPG